MPTSAAYSWTFQGTIPATPANLLIVADPDTAALVATVDASLDVNHESYIWEAQTGDEPWVEVARTADPLFTQYLANLNTDVALRVRDYNGGLSSDSLDGTGRLNSPFWWLTHVDGDPEFITPLRYVRGLGSVDDPIDQTVLQPLSSNIGEVQPPIVITGQRQGERISLTLDVMPEDAAIIRKLQRATREPPGSIGLKSPGGEVYRVAIGALRISAGAEPQRTVEVSAIRVA